MLAGLLGPDGASMVHIGGCRETASPNDKSRDARADFAWVWKPAQLRGSVRWVIVRSSIRTWTTGGSVC